MPQLYQSVSVASGVRSVSLGRHVWPSQRPTQFILLRHDTVFHQLSLQRCHAADAQHACVGERLMTLNLHAREAPGAVQDVADIGFHSFDFGLVARIG